MPSRPTSLAALLSTIALGAALTGCGVGQDPETYRERPTVDAALASIGGLELNNVRIDPPRYGQEEYPAGSDVPVTMTVVNTRSSTDALIAASSTAATTVELVDGEGKPVREVRLPVGPTSPDAFAVVLRSITEPLRPGTTTEITFSFRDGGRQTLLVPVAVYTQPAPPPEENPFEHGEEH